MTQEVVARPGAGEEVIKYFVKRREVHARLSEAPRSRAFHTLTAGEILASAGFTPLEQYELTRDSDQHHFESSDEPVPVEFGEEFTATFKGATPVS